MNVLAQIFGAFALLFLIISYQQKKRIHFLDFQFLANIFYCLQYLVLYAYSGVASFLISTIKMFIFRMNEKENKSTSVFVLIILEFSFIVLGILTYEKLYSLIPILCACLFTYGAWQRNLKITYFIGILVAIMSNVYDVIVGAYVSVISNFFELFASLIGFIRIFNINNINKQYNMRK